jgi:hypothetical protein
MLVVTIGSERIASVFTCTRDCDLIPVPAEIAVCPDCFAGLIAIPNEIESAIGNLHKVLVPTIYCRHSDDHGTVMTEDWFDTYDAVANWFETIFVDYSVCSLDKH